MYLSDRDLKKAIKSGKLIVEPKPESYDPTSIDLHLGSLDQAKIWDIDKFSFEKATDGHEPRELRIGKFNYQKFSPKYLMPPTEDKGKSVYRRGTEVIIKPHGFLIWQTQEFVGTPEKGANLICFVDGKSTRARTGIVVHLTAPTIHASWSGKITLEIVNLGPFDLVLEEGDVIAQLTVAKISSTPARNMKAAGSVTYGQKSVIGASN